MKLYIIGKVKIDGIFDLIELNRKLFKTLNDAENYLKEKDIIKTKQKYELDKFGYNNLYDVYEKKNNKNLETFYVIEELEV